MLSFLVIFNIACSSSRETTTANQTAMPTPILVEDPEAENKPPPVKRIQARHILIAHNESKDGPKNIRRNRFDARLKAEDVMQQIQGGQDFKRLSLKYSDDNSAARGGELGVFERGVMVEAFDTLAFNLKENQVGMVETQFGFHVVERMPLKEVHLTHVIVQWKGNSLSREKRSQNKAIKRIEEARSALLAGMSPEEVAKKYSDGSFGKRGGKVGWFQKGQLNPTLEAAAFQLQVAEISPIIESKLGYHLLIRNH